LTTRADRITSEAGFTALEIMLVVTIMAVVAGMAVMLTPRAIEAARADSSSQRLTAALRLAREQSISQRRDVIIELTGPNQVRVLREDIPGPDTTLLTDVQFEHGLQFVRFNGMPDTPDAFGGASAVDFGDATSIQFTSEGTLVDENDDVLNGTVFLGVPGQPLSARAVTIFGPTALIRDWRWDGARWVE
jgi:prepilin-type N-terminal cleavage/methylation domain-containing protein